MAVNDSTAPTSIPTTGAVGIGAEAGANRSINLLQNIKKATGASSSNSSINELRNFFKTYVGAAGNFNNTGNTNTQAGLGDFRGTYIYGFRLKVLNETTSTYGTNQDGKISFQGTFGEKTTYTVYKDGAGATTANHGITTEFGSLNGGNASTPRASYTLTVYHGSGTGRNTSGMSILVYVGYGAANPPYATYYGVSYTNIIDWTDFLIGPATGGSRAYPLSYP